MKEKGFTLIELLAVIIILAIISLIATPIILELIDDSRKSAGLSESNIILNSINNYCEQEKLKGSNNCNIEKLNKNKISEIINLGNAEILDIGYVRGKLKWLQVKSNNHIYSLQKHKMVEGKLEPPDLSGANEPELLNNMIPIRYDGTNWIYADINEEWYNYDKKEWANAVIVNDEILSKIINNEIKIGDEIKETYIEHWYVWIPRYKYQLFNINGEKIKEKAINISFENRNINSGNVICDDVIYDVNNEISEICKNKNSQDIKDGDWYTHPAFTFNNKELKGIWMGKFELSGNIDNIKTIPNKRTLVNNNISNIFNSIKKIDKDYQIKNGNSHMIKNMEWGAVTYLSNSNYGICNNNVCNPIVMNNSQLSGNGDYKIHYDKSTTNNIYGIYDMSSGNWEFVMGNMFDNKNNFYSSQSGFNIININEFNPYFDKYNYGTNNTIFSRGKLGDATKETLNWNKDAGVLPRGNNSWLVRGGDVLSGDAGGIFFFNCVNGSGGWQQTSRVVLVSNN